MPRVWVNRSVPHIGEVAQQNTSIVRDAERIVADLRERAERLAQAVRVPDLIR